MKSSKIKMKVDSDIQEENVQDPNFIMTNSVKYNIRITCIKRHHFVVLGKELKSFSLGTLECLKVSRQAEM